MGGGGGVLAHRICACRLETITFALYSIPHPLVPPLVALFARALYNPPSPFWWRHSQRGHAAVVALLLGPAGGSASADGDDGRSGSGGTDGLGITPLFAAAHQVRGPPPPTTTTTSIFNPRAL